MKRFSISLFFLSFFKQKPNFTCYRLRRSFSSPSLVFFLLPPSLFCFIFPFRASPTRRIELEIAAAPRETGGRPQWKSEEGTRSNKSKSKEQIEPSSKISPSALPLSSPLLDPRERASWPPPCSPRIGSEERKKKKKEKKVVRPASFDLATFRYLFFLFWVLSVY